MAAGGVIGEQPGGRAQVLVEQLSAGGVPAGLFPPRRDRRRLSLAAVHRRLVDWFRRQAFQELSPHEFMMVPERVPA